MDKQAESAVHIDEHALDKECIALPTDYLKYATLAADRKRDLDEMEAEVDVTKADIAKDIRENPSGYGLEKITEDALKQTVLRSPVYQKKLRSVIRAKHAYDLAQAVVWALEQKKRSLTNLIELAGLGMYALSGPKVSSRGRLAVEDMQSRPRKRFSNRED